MVGLRAIWAVLALTALAACEAAGPTEANGIRIIRASETDAILTGHVDALNAFRASSGLQPVRLSSRLTAAARTHARDMSVQERAWHFGSDGTSPRDRAERAGYTGRVLGENISESFDDEFEVFQSWLADPITRQVMRAPAADSVGFGWFQEQNGKIWWVQVIGQSGGTRVAAVPVTPG